MPIATAGTSEGSKTSVVTVTTIVDGKQFRRAGYYQAQDAVQFATCEGNLGFTTFGEYAACCPTSTSASCLYATECATSGDIVFDCSSGRACHPMTIKKASTATDDWTVTGYWCLPSNVPDILYRTLVGTNVQADATNSQNTIVLRTPTRTTHSTISGTTTSIESGIE
ncbi:hypothetical protein BO78DRAFT_244829 [Aspergillus sclerotiicarbonarius CBS 121057]|uniref:Uncharacterized protein n=1 Tax=Aspergillus sclerotiicarbonarius (strain CBS 121057 / IBT 28362) TaxID=1448318 RepID=A0A319ELL7_ASPSB|nr:hypothetical protein BO78DRAFT_244829 [Aspergillus sclerotiicarbonarius CBS 121057]